MEMLERVNALLAEYGLETDTPIHEREDIERVMVATIWALETAHCQLDEALKQLEERANRCRTLMARGSWTPNSLGEIQSLGTKVDAHCATVAALREQIGRLAMVRVGVA